ncbi:MAG: glycogen synthase GlgA [Candidatus Sumerlaeaceae bacterium]
MRILIVASEVVPFAKTGGLADVAGALPLELARMGHDVRVAMPKYGTIDDDKFHILPILGDIRVRLGNLNHVAEIRRTVFPDSNVPVYFVANSSLFDRANLYMEGGRDYPDNAERFAFFCKAVLWLLEGLDWTPEVIHCNDWQSALIPVFLRTDSDVRSNAGLRSVKTLFTIHNQAYQGVFPRDEAERIGIGDNLFHPAALEFYGALNLMKGGLLYADKISTVSPTYAREIQTPEYGSGLDGVLLSRASHLTGILNGIDYDTWNPETDKLIPAHFTRADLSGKSKCKAALQEEVGLDASPETPLIGIISRLDPQKGFDLIAEILEPLVTGNVQLVLLGTGAAEYHQIFERAAKNHPGKVSANLRFDNGLAHRIEAGSDFFLMPSHYEPCGLNQMYSLRYGTIPVVRKTGGLADSIVDATPENIESGRGTGFVFERYTTDELMLTLQRALSCFQMQPHWDALRQNAMSQDFSWRGSAMKYEQLFKAMVAL